MILTEEFSWHRTLKFPRLIPRATHTVRSDVSRLRRALWKITCRSREWKGDSHRLQLLLFSCSVTPSSATISQCLISPPHSSNMRGGTNRPSALHCMCSGEHIFVCEVALMRTWNTHNLLLCCSSPTLTFFRGGLDLLESQLVTIPIKTGDESMLCFFCLDVFA